MLITANQPSANGADLSRPRHDLAAVDRLVHHATIFEMNVESYRRRAAVEQKRKRGRPRNTRRPSTPQPVTRRGNQTEKGPLRATINAATIEKPRHRILILIVARFHPDCRATH